jgi:hypothetical protein
MLLSREFSSSLRTLGETLSRGELASTYASSDRRRILDRIPQSAFGLPVETGRSSMEAADEDGSEDAKSQSCEATTHRSYA